MGSFSPRSRVNTGGSTIGVARDVKQLRRSGTVGAATLSSPRSSRDDTSEEEESEGGRLMEKHRCASVRFGIDERGPLTPPSKALPTIPISASPLLAANKEEKDLDEEVNGIKEKEKKAHADEGSKSGSTSASEGEKDVIISSKDLASPIQSPKAITPSKSELALAGDEGDMGGELRSAISNSSGVHGGNKAEGNKNARKIGRKSPDPHSSEKVRVKGKRSESPKKTRSRPGTNAETGSPSKKSKSRPSSPSSPLLNEDDEEKRKKEKKKKGKGSSRSSSPSPTPTLMEDAKGSATRSVSNGNLPRSASAASSSSASPPSNPIASQNSSQALAGGVSGRIGGTSGLGGGLAILAEKVVPDLVEYVDEVPECASEKCVHLRKKQRLEVDYLREEVEALKVKKPHSHLNFWIFQSSFFVT